MIPIVLLVILGIVTWVVASEGIWGAALTFLSVIFAGLIAMNFFEPLAGMLDAQVPSWRNRFDFIALLGIFAISVSILRELAARIAPVSIEVHPYFYQAGRWVFSAATGYVTVGILLTALHTVNLPFKAFLGFRPEAKNLMEISAPDRQWLAFTQHVSEKIFPKMQTLRHVQQGWDDRCVRIFDGMRMPKAGKSEAEYFPTFIIRYTTRRVGSKPRTAAPAAPVGGGAGGGGGTGAGGVNAPAAL